MSIQDAPFILSSRERLDRIISEGRAHDGMLVSDQINEQEKPGSNGYHPVLTNPPQQTDELANHTASIYERGLCGIGVCHPQWSQRLANLYVFVVTYGIAGIWMTTLSALLGSQITSIERHLGLSSSKTGLLMSSNEIGYLIVVILGSHIGKYSHIPRCLSVSGIIFGLATAAMSFARFVEPNVWRNMAASGQLANISTSHDPSAKYLCNLDTSIANGSRNNFSNETSPSPPEQTDYHPELTSSLPWGFWVIFLFSMVGGAVKSYRLPLMTCYVETNIVDKSRTGLLIGTAFTAMIFGPPVAMFLGAFTSSLPVDLKETTISKYDHRWIGAWWLGLVIVGLSCTACSLPIMLFPRHILKTKMVLDAKAKAQDHESLRTIFVELPKSLGRIFRRPIFVLCLLFSCIEGFAFAGWFAFSQKYMETQFNKTSQQVSTLTGTVTVFALVLGTFTGGAFTSKFKLSLRGCAIISLAITCITLLGDSLHLIFGCSNSKVVGLDGESPVTSSDYSRACDCSDDTFIVCGDDGVNYLSPCLAGCVNVTNMIFSNCTNINNGAARPGLCELDCNFLIPYMVVFFCSFFMGCASIVPSFMLVIRSVELRDQSLASGTASFCQTLMGMLPSPILFGKVIDSTCRLWSPGGSYCMLYDREKFRFVYQGLSLSLRLVSVVVMVLVLWLVLRQRRNDSSDTNKSKDATR